MTIQEIVKLLMEHVDEYAVECEEEVPENGVMVHKKCKKISVTLDTIIDFCTKYNYPLPMDDLQTLFAATLEFGENNNGSELDAHQ